MALSVAESVVSSKVTSYSRSSRITFSAPPSSHIQCSINLSQQVLKTQDSSLVNTCKLCCRDCQEVKLDEQKTSKELQEKLYKATLQWTKMEKGD